MFSRNKNEDQKSKQVFLKKVTDSFMHEQLTLGLDVNNNNHTSYSHGTFKRWKYSGNINIP